MDCPATVAEHLQGETRWKAGEQPWQRLGTVVGLRICAEGSYDPEPVGHMVAVAGIGLEGDTHAHPLSPRQVLVASSDVYQDLGLEPMTLRENLLVDFATERLSSSTLLQIGPEIVLWLTFQCEACGHLEHRHPGVVKSIHGRRGILARVVRGGRMSIGDEVRRCTSSIPPMSSMWQERIAGVLQRVPAGKRVEYRQLARLAGVPKAYCRVFPKILSQLPPALANRAQVGTVAQIDERWTGEGLFDVSKNISGLTALNH